MPPLPELTMDQRALRSVRWSSQMGCAVGITVGCIIGMFPLLFYDPEGKEEKKHHQNEEEGKRKNNLIDPKSDGKEDVVKGGIVGAASDNSKLESSSSVNNISKTENEKQSALEKESSNLDGILLDTVKAARKAIGAETVNLFLVVENPTPSAALEQSSKSTTSNPNNDEGMKAQLADTKVQSKITRYLLAKYSDLDTQIHSTDKLSYSLSPLCIPLENADDAMQKCACNGEVVLWNGNE